MAPQARRIPFGTYVVPTKSIEAEEVSVRHTEFQDSPAGTMGGKGTASITATQWGDGWASMTHHGGFWEDQSENWSVQGATWTGEISISTTPSDLTDDENPLKFLYIKNTGSTNNVLVALDETGIAGGGSTDGNYYIVIPPGGSVALRGDGTNLECDEVFVKSNTSTTTIEYIIAK